MRTIASWFSLLVVVGACGDDSGGGGGNDGGGDDDTGPITYPISFEILGDTPHLVAIKNENELWQKLPIAVNGMYSEIRVTHRHTIAFVCGAEDALFETTIEMRTTLDPQPFLFCFNYEDTGTTTRHPVTGTMQQAGQVDMVLSDSSTTMPWSFELEVSAGVHDFFAFGASKMLIQRNIVVNGPTSLGTIDVAANGTDYAVTSALVTNLDGDTSRASTFIYTENGIGDYSIEGTTVHAAPASLLVGSDFQSASIYASSATTERSSRVEIGSSVSLTLLPKLVGVEFGPTGPSWVVLPEQTSEVRYSTLADSKYLGVNATSNYLGDLATSLDIDLDLPDYDNAWRPTIGGGRLVVYDEDANSTSVIAPLMSARSRRPAALQLRWDRAALRAGASATVVRARR